MAIEYLINDEREVLKHRGKSIKNNTDKIMKFIEDGDYKGLQEYENDLLNEFGMLKLRIDIHSQNDYVDEVKVYEDRLNLSAVNKLLHTIISINPNSELGRFQSVQTK